MEDSTVNAAQFRGQRRKRTEESSDCANKCNLRRNSLPDKYQVELMIYHNTDKRRNENEYIQKNRIEVI